MKADQREDRPGGVGRARRKRGKGEPEGGKEDRVGDKASGGRRA